MSTLPNANSNQSLKDKFKVVTKQTFTKKDGKLNYVSIGLMVLILALTGTLTATIITRTSPGAIQEDIVNGLSSEEAQKAIQNAFLTGINEYLNGDITEDQVYDRIMQLLADYVNASSAFTDDQKTELLETIKDYLNEINLQDMLTSNEQYIQDVEKTFNKYVTENERTRQILVETLQKELNDHATYTQEQLNILNELHEELVNTEKLHYATITEKVYETIRKFDHLNDENKHNMFNGLTVWQAGAEYAINSYVIYNVGQDYGYTNEVTGEFVHVNDGVIENDRDVRIYMNLTGNNTETSPNKDTKNWKEMSLATAIQNIYEITTADIPNFDKWLSEHTFDLDGQTVINQLVTYNQKIYQNITGEYNPDLTPDQDSTNWKEVSLLELIQDNFNDLLNRMAGDQAGWVANQTYEIESYVIYKNQLYRNITGENTDVSPDKDTVNWSKTTVYGEINYLNQTFLEKLFAGIEEWSAEASYIPNSYVMYEHKLYRNIKGGNTSTTPDLDTENWEESSIMTVVNNTYNTFMSVMDATPYVPDKGNEYSDGQYVVYDNVMYKNVDGNPSTGDSTLPGSDSAWQKVSITAMIDGNYQTFINTVGAEDYNPAHTYQAGDYVIYNGTLYRASDSTTGSFDSFKWEKVSVTNSIETLSTQLDELQLQVSLNNEQLDKNLTDLIEKNKSLSDEQRAKMLDIINNNADVTADGLKDLEEQLLAVINDNTLGDAAEKAKNEKEREKLLEQFKALEDNTSSYMDSYEKRIKDLEERTTTKKGFVNSEDAFQYDEQNGIHGYTVNGVFHPF